MHEVDTMAESSDNSSLKLLTTDFDGLKLGFSGRISNSSIVDSVILNFGNLTAALMSLSRLRRFL